MNESSRNHPVVPYSAATSEDSSELRCITCQAPVVRERNVWRHLGQPQCATPRPYTRITYNDRHETACLGCNDTLIRVDGVYRHAHELKAAQAYTRPPEADI
jgi:NAD-dependent SIR2 family protein deacetylase